MLNDTPVKRASSDSSQKILKGPRSDSNDPVLEFRANQGYAPFLLLRETQDDFGLLSSLKIQSVWSSDSGKQRETAARTKSQVENPEF